MTYDSFDAPYNCDFIIRTVAQETHTNVKVFVSDQHGEFMLAADQSSVQVAGAGLKPVMESRSNCCLIHNSSFTLHGHDHKCLPQVKVCVLALLYKDEL